MPLNSLLLGRNARLEQCHCQHQHHVTTGATGIHVSLIQAALAIVDGARVDESEVASERYGRSTAAAVLAHKKKLKIINTSYQSEADSIVGRMTIEALDKDVHAKEMPWIRLTPVGGGPFLRSLLFAPVTTVRSKLVVATEQNSPWFGWAKNFKAHNAIGDIVPIANGVPPATLVSNLRSAAAMAGPGGMLALSVGHGGHGEGLLRNEGYFDLAPKGAFRVAGANAVLPGDPPPPRRHGQARPCIGVLRFSHSERLPGGRLHQESKGSRSNGERFGGEAEARPLGALRRDLGGLSFAIVCDTPNV